MLLTCTQCFNLNSLFDLRIKTFKVCCQLCLIKTYRSAEGISYSVSPKD